MTTYFHVTNNTKIYVHIEGEGRPIIFLHGWPFAHNIFKKNFFDLKKNYKCIGIDLRGFGLSSKNFSSYTLQNLVDDVHEVILQLNLDIFILLGYSLGATVALKCMALFECQSVQKLVLVSAAAPRFTRSSDFRIGIAKSIIDKMFKDCESNKELLISNQLKMLFHDMSGIDNDIMQELKTCAKQASVEAMQQTLLLLREVDLRSCLSKIKIPTVIFHGMHDLITPFSFARSLQEYIPHADIIRFAKSGHMLFVEERELFNSALIHFAHES